MSGARLRQATSRKIEVKVGLWISTEVGSFCHRITVHSVNESGRFRHNSAISLPWRTRPRAERTGS